MVAATSPKPSRALANSSLSSTASANHSFGERSAARTLIAMMSAIITMIRSQPIILERLAICHRTSRVLSSVERARAQEYFQEYLASLLARARARSSLARIAPRARRRGRGCSSWPQGERRRRPGRSPPRRIFRTAGAARLAFHIAALLITRLGEALAKGDEHVESPADRELMNPTTGITGCCARAASG